MEIEPGRVLSGRYRLIRPLGQGSQASVWVAEHLALTTQVAVKLIDPDLAKREDARERFRREATAAAQLRSAHVVQMLDHGIDGVQPFIVMELLDGEDLFERLDKRGRITLRETSKIVTQVARALSRAHAAGIVHRDLKPENVFLVTNEDEEVVKVFDFGVAKVTDPTKAVMSRTSVGQLIGTPHYMSPEQVKGTGEVDFRADLWALGVITYQCVTGHLPFDSEGVGDLLIKITIGDIPVPSKLLPGLPPAFDAWFSRACHRDPLMRFESARELAESLARAVRGAHDAPGVASIPRPASQQKIPAVVPPAPSVPAPSVPAPSVPAPSVPAPSMKAQVPEPAISRPPPPMPSSRRVEIPAPAAPKLPGKRALAESLGADDVEEVMDFDEEPQVKASPLLGQAAEKPKDAKTPPPPPMSGPASRAVAAPPSSTPSSGGSSARATPPPLPSAAPAQEPAPQSEAASPIAPSTPAGLDAVSDVRTAPDADQSAPAPSEAASIADAAPPSPAPSPSLSPSPEAAPAPIAPAAPVPLSPALPADSALHAAEPPAPPAPAPPAPPARVAAPAPAPTNFTATAPPSTVPAYSASDLSGIDDPPEFDGTRRKRYVKYLTLGLIAAAALITWVVISSQIPPQPASPQGSSSVPQVIEPPPPPPQPTETAAASAAVDPIKPAASTTAQPSSKPKGPGKPGPYRKPKPKEDDMTIEIPDVPPE
jgi:serine/threonine-protein kinase